MSREEAKEMFRSDKNAYGKPKHVMANIDKIYESFDQETQRLKAELAEKDKLYSDLLFRYDERSKGLSYYQKLSINLQSELTELKEKHKGDVMDGYNEGYRDGESDGKSANPNDLDVKLFSNAEQYYNETHKTK